MSMCLCPIGSSKATRVLFSPIKKGHLISSLFTQSFIALNFSHYSPNHWHINQPQPSHSQILIHHFSYTFQIKHFFPENSSRTFNNNKQFSSNMWI